MKSDPNEIWDRFDEFVRSKMKNHPEGFVYPDLKKWPQRQHEDFLHEVLDAFCRHESNHMFRDFAKEWATLESARDKI